MEKVQSHVAHHLQVTYQSLHIHISDARWGMIHLGSPYRILPIYIHLHFPSSDPSDLIHILHLSGFLQRLPTSIDDRGDLALTGLVSYPGITAGTQPPLTSLHTKIFSHLRSS